MALTSNDSVPCLTTNTFESAPDRTALLMSHWVEVMLSPIVAVLGNVPYQYSIDEPFLLILIVTAEFTTSTVNVVSLTFVVHLPVTSIVEISFSTPVGATGGG